MMRILLADDDLTSQRMGAKILAAAGHDVITASNGLAALKRIANFRPDVVLLDIYLPGYGGVEISNTLNATPGAAHISVLLTVGKMEPFRFADVASKIDGVITKPYTAGELICAIANLAVPPCLAVTQLELWSCNTVTGPEHAVAGVPLRASSMTTAREGLPCSRLRLQSGQTCDVCGHVNSQAASVCDQCDVPLPSAVIFSGTSRNSQAEKL